MKLDDLDFIRIPRKEVRHDRHLEERLKWDEQRKKVRAEVVMRRALRKASNLEE